MPQKHFRTYNCCGEEERVEYFMSLSKPISTANLFKVSRCTILERVLVRKPSCFLQKRL